MDYNIIEALKEKLEEPLPGIEAQKTLSPVDHRPYLDVKKNHLIASVMMLLYPKNKEWYVCYIERTSHNVEDKHAGQISFPGGRYEESDLNFEQCALRETHEEIGINPSKIKVIGALSSLYVYVSNFVVYPFIGYADEQVKFDLQESEVSSIIEVPLSYLSQKQIIKSGTISIRNMVLKEVPYYDLYGQKLWGATAMMTSEFLHLYDSIHNPIIT